MIIKNHAYCPECGSDNSISTLMSFTFDTDDPDSYEDRNNVTCCCCSWKGIAHDLVGNQKKDLQREFRINIKTS